MIYTYVRMWYLLSPVKTICSHFIYLFIYLFIQYLYRVSILAEASLSRALIKIKGYTYIKLHKKYKCSNKHVHRWILLAFKEAFCQALELPKRPHACRKAIEGGCTIITKTTLVFCSFGQW